MPLLTAQDYGNTDLWVCLYCVDKNWNIKSAEEIFDWWVLFFMSSTWCTKEESEKVVRKNMNSLEFWKKNNSKVLDWLQATDEEFNNALRNIWKTTLNKK